MVEKIIVNPTEVRGLGNIMNVKTDEDYELVDCTITEATDTINGVSMTVYLLEPDLGESTTLTVTSSSSTLVLDGTVTISATLKDSSNVAISGATITFKEGSTTLGTGTTNSSGVATYTYTGATTGSHTVSGVFGGDSTYASSTGSVSLTVIDHSYSLAFSQASYAATSGSATLSVTLKDNNVAVSGATVSVAGSDSSLYSGITNSDGVAEVTVINVSAETTFTATYSNATATCTVTVQALTLSLSANKNILSYSDSETATLTAVYSGGSGATIELYNAATSAKIGNFTDAGNGNYTYSYSSAGTGDIVLMAKVGATESSTVTIEDCIFYDISSSSNLSKYTVPSGLSFTFDTDHYICKTTSQDWKNLNRTFTSSATTFTFSFDVLFTNNRSNTQMDTYVLGTNNKGMSVLTAPVDSVYRLSSATGVGTQTNPVNKSYSYTRNVWYHIETIVQNGTTTTNMYQNDNLVETITNTNISFSNLNKLAFYIGWDPQAIIHLKNIKIKPI